MFTFLMIVGIVNLVVMVVLPKLSLGKTALILFAIDLALIISNAIPVPKSF